MEKPQLIWNIFVEWAALELGKTLRTRLTEENLKAILMIGCCASNSNLDDILNEKRQFHKSS